MGLRFRKSISLCKGVRLNVGKTGVSISAGIPGFRKTIHSSGRVTTTVGIPGSGLYYVETDHIDKKKKQKSDNQGCSAFRLEQQNTFVKHSVSTEKEKTSWSIDNKLSNGKEILNYYLASPAIKTSSSIITESEISTVSKHGQETSSFRELFENCDLPVNWIDVLINREPLDDSYDDSVWSYLHSKAVSVFEGNVAAMLQIIDELSPFDDLNLYVSDFCVEMDNPAELSIEFSVTKDIAPRNEQQDAICSVVIRAARDAFALLPVERVIVHTMLDGNTIIAAKLDRETFASLEFEGKDPSDLLEAFEVNMNYSSLIGFCAVERILSSAVENGRG